MKPVLLLLVGTLLIGRPLVANDLLLSTQDPFGDNAGSASLSPATVLAQRFSLTEAVLLSAIEVSVGQYNGSGSFEWAISTQVGPGTLPTAVLASGVEAYPLVQQQLSWNPEISLPSGNYWLVFSEDPTSATSSGTFLLSGCYCYPSPFGTIDGPVYYALPNPGFAPGAFLTPQYRPLDLDIYGQPLSAGDVPEPRTLFLWLGGLLPCLFWWKHGQIRATNDKN